MVGKTLGHYEILEPLGAGGMGEVYRARDTKLDRDVAIKVLPEDFATDPDRLARFEREAKLLAALNHPNIAAIYGLEDEGDQRFIAMELVDGETLAAWISRSGRIEVDEALEIARQIAEALEAAHEKGVIHRDLKPANVIVTPEGKVKVLDFGLAKAFEAEGAESGISVDLSASPTMMAATQAGVILGTAAYMSPEQARGKPVDKRTDIWAFGCVLYEMLTGAQVFEGETATDILGAIVHQEPDFGRLPPSTPASVVRLLRRCLAKEAGRRARDAWDLRVEIAQALEEPEEVPVSALAKAAPGWRRVFPWVVAAAALLIAGLSFLSSRGTPTSGAAGVMRFAMPVPDGTRLVSAPSISPDGLLIAVAAEPVGRTGSQLYLRRVGDDDPVLLPGTEFARNPFFSPDGQWIGFSAQDKLMKIAVTGGASVLIADTEAAYGATWTEDDRIVFANFGGPLMQVPAGGGEPTVVASLSEERREEGFLWPSVLPGGDAVLVTITTEGLVSTDEALIATISLETGEQTILVRGGSGARFVETGHLIYARAGTLRAVGFDPETLLVREPSVQVLEGLSTRRTSGEGLFAAAGNGTLVYLPGGPDPDSALVWVDRQGNVTPAVEAREGFFSARISPDGQRAAVIRGWASHELWIYDLSRGTAIPLAQESDTHSPLWAPDGRSVFYSRKQGESESIFVRSADGRGEETRLLEGGGRPRTITPDGAMLIVVRTVDGVASNWQLPLEGDGALTRVHDSRFREGDARLSPDGRWLAYASFETGRSELYLEPYPRGERRWQVSTAGAGFPVWSGDSSELFFTNQNRLMAVTMLTAQDPPFREPTLLFEGDFWRRSPVFSGDVAPSGDRFLMVELPSSPPPTGLPVILNWFEELKQRVPTGRNP